MPPTEPTRQLPAARASRFATRARLADRRLSGPAWGAALLMLAAMIILIAMLTGGASSPPTDPSRPKAAPAGAPLSEQLRALDRIVDDASAR